MSTLRFARSHELGLDTARSNAQRLADDLRDKYDLVNDWQGDVLHFRRAGLCGTLTVTDQQIQLEARLGLLLAVFAPRIEARLASNFERYFG